MMAAARRGVPMARWALCVLALGAATFARLTGSAQAATCTDHSTQAAAQRAGDTRDGDGDGRYCESLPCPCAGPGSPGGTPGPDPAPTPRPTSNPASCVKPAAVQPIGFSASRYPTIRAHTEAAVARGWPRVLVVNRDGADARRDRLLSLFPTRPVMDRDEYPPAVGRGRGKDLRRGTSPIGWKADVGYVPSSENRSHGSRLGSKLRRLCNGTRFRYVFY
jgi:hypothetical protein